MARRDSGWVVATRFGPTDFLALAGSTGAVDYRMKHTGEFRATLERALAKKTKAVIEKPIDYRENLRLVHPKPFHPFE